MDHEILIVDDHEGFRAVARAMLEADGFVVVGEAADGDGAMAAAARWPASCRSTSCPGRRSRRSSGEVAAVRIWLALLATVVVAAGELMAVRATVLDRPLVRPERRGHLGRDQRRRLRPWSPQASPAPRAVQDEDRLRHVGSATRRTNNLRPLT